MAENLPMMFGAYRLCNQTQDGSVGFYQINPNSSCAIWLVDESAPEAGGFWPMVYFDDDGWQTITTEPLPTFTAARAIIQSYCKVHGFEEEEGS
jgi:hypothetical protein